MLIHVILNYFYYSKLVLLLTVKKCYLLYSYIVYYNLKMFNV